MGLQLGLSYVITYIIAYVTTYVITYVIAYVIAYLIAYLIRYVIIYVIMCVNAYLFYLPYYIQFCIRNCIPPCLDSQFRDVSPDAAQIVPTSNSEYFSSFSLVSHVYRTLDVKNRRSPAGLGKNFGRLNGRKISLAKVVDFVPLGALSGPGAPDPDLDHFQCNLDSGRTAY